MKALFTLPLIMALCTLLHPVAQASQAASPDSHRPTTHLISGNKPGAPKIPLDTLDDPSRWLNERVIVNGDTVPLIIPEKNYGRFDRGLYNFLIIPKGQWAFGMTASYGEFDTDDVQILDILNNFDINIKAYSIKPYISYFIKNNQSIGIKFDYTHMGVDLANMALDIDDDLNFSLRDVSYSSQSFSASVSYRNYVGLGPQKRFAIFNEVDLGFGTGSSRFRRIYNDEMRLTSTNTIEAALNFSPGLCVFIMDNVCFNVSFGVFGLHLLHERQITDGIDDGSRFSSGANFKFNIFNINFGIAVHI